jgi:hypothetical protein
MHINSPVKGHEASAFSRLKRSGAGGMQCPSRISAAELLESRIAPAYISFVSGPIVTFAGDGASDTLVFSAEDGFLKHNRFTAGDSGFASDFDFNNNSPGVQMVAADPSTVMSIQLGTGDDTVILGGDGHASLLKAAFTLTNTGIDGDELRIDDSAATEGLAITAAGNIVVGAGLNITRAGDVFGLLDLRTGSGSDTITLNGVLAQTNVVVAGSGDDTVAGQIASSPLTIDGGEGNDLIAGGFLNDILIGGEGNDVLTGGNGDDFAVGGDGLDTFTWVPGDDNDFLEGQGGSDVLVFSGSVVAETFNIIPNGGRVLLLRSIANVGLDLNDIEEVQLNTFGGSDVVNVGDLTGTDLRALRVDLADPLGNPDGAADALVLNGTPNSDDVHVVTDGTKIQAVGLLPFVELSGFDVIDQLNITPAGGTDNFFASDAAKAKLNIVHSAETSNGQLVGDLTFTEPAHQTVGKTPSAIASGNLIGPGNDLVVTNAKTNSISILLNTGDGTFLPAIDLKTGGKKPTGVALGDFNGDDRLDIAVTNKGSGNVSVFFNKGGGTFSDPVLFAVGKAPGKLRAADVTGDGRTDLVMLSGSNKLTILASDGSGGFATPSKLSTGGLASVELVLGDFSGDGRMDIAVANAGSKNVTVLQADPTFVFGAPVKFKVGSSPRSLAAGDIDGDGRLDLAVSHRINKFVSVLLNASTGGTLAFNPEIKVENIGKRAPSAIALEDIDLDGHDDLVLTDATAGAISVLLNTGPATFLPAVTFDLGQSVRGKNIALAVTDLNEDGRPDFAVANAAVSDLSIQSRVLT